MDRVLANDDAPPETPMLEETTATPNTHTQETTAIPSSSITHPTLITYVYSESPENRANLEFFLHHGLHAHADFIFIFNGETDAASLLPSHPNINHVARNNTCYDLGAHAEVLTKDSLWKSYSKFILMNASVRGPFLPHWAEACWSDRFLNKLSDTVKVCLSLSSNNQLLYHIYTPCADTSLVSRNNSKLLANPSCTKHGVGDRCTRPLPPPLPTSERPCPYMDV